MMGSWIVCVGGLSLVMTEARLASHGASQH